MFEFLFKRPGDQPDAPAGSGAASPPPADPGAAAQARVRQAEQLAALGADEDAAAAFILACDFSDLRLAAAAHLHSAAQLERVYTAIRNTDRRVGKLVHGRLEALRHAHAEAERARACIDQARQLAAEPQLLPNQVADLDRRWSVIAAPALAPEFDAVRAVLRERLEAQVALQRRLIDAVAALRLAAGSADAALVGRIAAVEQTLAAPEQDSLPRSLRTEAQAVLAHARTLAAASVQPGPAEAAPAVAHPGPDAAAAAAQGAAPDAPDAPGEFSLASGGALAAPGAAMPVPVFDGPAASCLPAGPAADGGAHTGIDIGPAAAPAGAPAPEPSAGAPRPPRAERAPGRAAPQLPKPDQAFLAKVEALETAVQEGALHHAAELDKELKETRGVRLGAGLTDRLTRARAELKRLNDWARWGGNVSREELIRSADALPALHLPMGELAQKIGSLRERWKKLDSVSGAAPKALWERFDAACTTAYAPAAAHFKHLADERHANAARGQALVDEASAAAAPEAALDWKQRAALVQKLTLAWSHLGAIDRKEKKRLDAAFHNALVQLEAPLAARREEERARREQLIAEVQAIAAQDRHALDLLRQAQERWQQAAKALPLERKLEQALWQRFRAACDALFNQRKEGAHAADAQRRAHLQAREAICARLEQADAAEGAGVLRVAASDWQATGPVPRASEARVEQRYHAAVAAFQHKLDTARRVASVAQAGALRAKLQLLHELEAAGAGASHPAASAAVGSTGANLAGKAAIDMAAPVAPEPADVITDVTTDVTTDLTTDVITAVTTDGAPNASGPTANPSDIAAGVAFAEPATASAPAGLTASAGADASAAWTVRWNELPALPAKVERVLRQRFEAACGARTAVRPVDAAAQAAQRATVREGLLKLEISLGIDSGAEFARERLRLQVEVLQNAFKSGHAPGAELATFLALLALPVPAEPRTLRRIEQIYTRLVRDPAREPGRDGGHDARPGRADPPARGGRDASGGRGASARADATAARPGRAQPAGPGAPDKRPGRERMGGPGARPPGAGMGRDLPAATTPAVADGADPAAQARSERDEHDEHDERDGVPSEPVTEPVIR